METKETPTASRPDFRPAFLSPEAAAMLADLPDGATFHLLLLAAAPQGVAKFRQGGKLYGVRLTKRARAGEYLRVSLRHLKDTNR